MAGPLLGYTAFSHVHSLAPDTVVPEGAMGPRALPVSLSVSTTAPQSFDLQREIEGGQIDNIQAVFIDNSGNTSPLSVVSSEIPGMPIKVKANSQGTYPFYGKQLSTITVSTSNASLTPINLVFLNTPHPYAQWLST